MASSKRTSSYVKGFSKNGYHSTVIIPVPKDVNNTESNHQNYIGRFNGGTFCYPYKKVFRSKSFVKRRIDDLFGYITTLIFIIKKINYNDKIIVYRGGFFWYFLICLFSKIKGVNVFLELNELPYINHNNIAKKIKSFFLYKISFPLFDGFIVISENLKKVALKHKSQKARILKTPIIVEVDAYPPKVINNSNIYLCHIGTLNQEKDGVFDMILSFALSKDRVDQNIKFYLAGTFDNANDKTKVYEIIQTHQIQDRIKFLGKLDSGEVKDLLINASLAIMTKHSTEQNQYGFPTKLGEYLAAGVPLIMTKVGESLNYLENNIHAYLVESNQPEQISLKIIELLSNKQKQLNMALNGQELARRKFNYLIETQKIIDFCSDKHSKSYL